MQFGGLLNTLAGIGNATVALVPSSCASLAETRIFVSLVKNAPKDLNNFTRSLLRSLRDAHKGQEGGVCQITS